MRRYIDRPIEENLVSILQDKIKEVNEKGIKGAEWLIANIDLLKDKGLTGFVDSIDEAVEKHATLLFNVYETSTFSEEEKENLYDSFSFMTSFVTKDANNIVKFL